MGLSSDSEIIGKSALEFISPEDRVNSYLFLNSLRENLKNKFIQKIISQ